MDKRWACAVCAMILWGSMAGCAGASAPASGPSPTGPGATAKPATSEEHAAAAATAALLKPSTDAPGAPSEEPAHGTGAAPGFDLQGWLAARKVKTAPPKDASCEPGQLGNPAVDALSCDEKQATAVPPVARKKGEEPATYSQPRIPLSIYTWYRRIYVVSNGALRKVFEIPFEVVPSDPNVGEPTQDAYVMMKVEIDPDGTKLEVFEDQMLNCDQVKTKLSELAQEAEMANVVAAARKAADQVCASKGEYLFRNGAFARKR